MSRTWVCRLFRVSPGGAEVGSQGRKPLVGNPTSIQAPEGRQTARCDLSPLRGCSGADRHTRGVRPSLPTAAPQGLNPAGQRSGTIRDPAGVIAVALLLALSAGRVSAEPPDLPVTKLTVSPAAAPVPALKYELLPELRDSTPGNAALLYYRAFAPEWSQNIRGNKDLQKNLDEALDKSPAELKRLSDLHFVRSWGMLKEVDRAARRAYCDWELTPRLREEGISLLIPDVQGLREFARYLKIRAKLELADRQFDKMAYTLQTGLQLGRHAAHGPTLIQGLVGAAISAIMLGEAEEWVGTPGSPNLYWALTNLPQPFIDLRMGFQGERLMLENLLPGFHEALVAGHMRPMTQDKLHDIVSTLSQITGGPTPPTVLIVAVVAKNYGPAKEYLKQNGWPAEEVEALPAIQVVLLHEAATYDRLYDEMLKWQGLPYAIAKPALERFDRELKEESARTGRMSLAALLLPAVTKVNLAQARRDRQINLLRTIEALRLYAAAHGQWPDRLADITDVPVPIDPISGQPLEYRRDGNKAFLTAPPPAGEPAHQANSDRYEITLKK